MLNEGYIPVRRYRGFASKMDVSRQKPDNIALKILQLELR